MLVSGTDSVTGTKEQLASLCRCRPQEIEVASIELSKYKVAIVNQQDGSTTLASRRLRRELNTSELKRKGGLARAAQAQQTRQQPAPARSTSTSTSTSKKEGECEGKPSVEINGHPTLGEVLGRAGIIGLAPWRAKDWWDEMDGCGWVDYQGRPIRNWQSAMNRVKTKWESDGRPTGPPKPRNQSNSQIERPKTDEEILREAIG